MIALIASALDVTVLPEVGGKIAQIRFKRAGQDLLVEPRRPYSVIPADRPWVDYDTSGMDDCFPNVEEGRYPVEPWRDRPLPQLGEWVRGSWNTVRANDVSVTLERPGSVLPYFARKSVELAGPATLRLSYEVKNVGTNGFHYIWSAHPLVAAGETFILRLPGDDLSFVTHPADGRQYRWPAYRGTDLSREWIAAGKTLKIFVAGMSAGWCELITAGRLLRFEFDLNALPFVGLWFNHYGFRGGGVEPFRCVAVEPCTSPTDVLDAGLLQQCPYLAPATSVNWSFSLVVA